MSSFGTYLRRQDQASTGIQLLLQTTCRLVRDEVGTVRVNSLGIVLHIMIRCMDVPVFGMALRKLTTCGRFTNTSSSVLYI